MNMYELPFHFPDVAFACSSLLIVLYFNTAYLTDLSKSTNPPNRGSLARQCNTGDFKKIFTLTTLHFSADDPFGE